MDGEGLGGNGKCKIISSHDPHDDILVLPVATEDGSAKTWSRFRHLSGAKA